MGKEGSDLEEEPGSERSTALESSSDSPRSVLKEVRSFEQYRSLGKASGSKVRFAPTAEGKEALLSLECGNYKEGGRVTFGKATGRHLQAAEEYATDSDSDSDTAFGSSLGSIGRGKRRARQQALRPIAKMDDDLAKSLMARAMQSMRPPAAAVAPAPAAGQEEQKSPSAATPSSPFEEEECTPGGPAGDARDERPPTSQSLGDSSFDDAVPPAEAVAVADDVRDAALSKDLVADVDDKGERGDNIASAEAEDLENAEKVVFVCGATGLQGGAVVRHILRNTPYRVRALTRNSRSAKAKALASLDPRVELFEANMVSKDRLFQGMLGCFAVFSMQNFYDSGYEHEIRQGRAVATAAREAAVEHLVYSSIAGADPEMAEQDAASAVPLQVQSKSRIEGIVQAAGLPYTILRSCCYMENLVMPVQRYHPKLHWAMLRDHFPATLELPMVGVEDLAAAVCAVLQKPGQFLDATITLAGDLLSYSDVFKHFYQVTQKEPDHGFPFPFLIFRYLYPDYAELIRYTLEIGPAADPDATREFLPSVRDWRTYLQDVLSVNVPPRWVPDFESDTCQQCDRAFGFLTRRHHCRSCGSLLCAGCASVFRPLPQYFITDAVRICGPCDQRLDERGAPHVQHQHEQQELS